MRILFLCLEQSNDHGWAKFCLNLSKILSSQPEISVVTGSNINSIIRSNSNSQFHLKSNNRHNPKQSALIRDLLTNIKFFRETDLIIAGDEFSFPIAYLAARLFRKRLILNIHGTYALRGMIGKRGSMFIAAYRYAEIIFSVSNYTKSQLVLRKPELIEKIIVSPLAEYVNSPDILPPQQAQENHFVIIGAIKPRKGVIKAIQALKMVRDNGHDVSLKIIGKLDQSEKYVQRLNQFVDQHDLRPHVEFCGFLPAKQKDRLIAKSISNLLPSQNIDGSFEGFGFVHLEAGRLATPSIGSLDCGNEDAIIDQKTGFLVAQDDLCGLAKCMETLHINKILRNRMGLAAQKSCTSWTWQDVGELYMKWLR